MMRARPDPRRHLGMKDGELAGKAYARFWRPKMDALAAHVIDALAHGPAPAPLLAPLEAAPRLVDPKYEDGSETVFGVRDDGALHVALTTPMRGATPAMVDWWFGWHSAEPQRYKLWHPRAHVHAQWRNGDAPSAGARGRDAYVGRTSIVDEYLGDELGRFAIRFVDPRDLGFDGAALADAEQATAVCARVGFADLPFDAGWLVHHVKRTHDGCEMRSRFWLGGPHAAARSGGALGALAVGAAKQIMKPKASDGRALLVHCAEEMAHLATFLPAIYAELRDTD
jgi:hypothetical protein